MREKLFGGERGVVTVAIAVAGAINLGVLLLATVPWQSSSTVARGMASPSQSFKYKSIPRVGTALNRAMAIAQVTPGMERATQAADRAGCLARASWEKTLARSSTYVPASEFQGKTTYTIAPTHQEKVVALTFDDGPWQHTLPILDILRENQVKATFFMVGRHLTTFPDIAKRVASEGHAIANHTWNHRYHSVGTAEAASEIDRTADLIYQNTGVRTTIFRPPGGNLTNGLAAYAKSKRYVVAMWSVDSLDYRHQPAAQLANRVVQQAHPGAVILLHDGGGNRTRTVEALPAIVKGLKDKGYGFVTMPELLRLASLNQNQDCLVQ